MDLLLYHIFLKLYALGIFVAALRNKKAQQWIQGRKTQKAFSVPLKKNSRIWMHCASVGEFEQGRPLIEALKKQHPEVEIILTFFSPSGYEVYKNYTLTTAVLYLPLDGKRRAQQFIERWQPDCAIFVKYEFWYYYLNRLKQKNIPTFLVSAVFRPQQIFFKSYGKFFRKLLLNYQQIFVQDEASQKLLKKIEVPSVVAGDTRFDRVMEIAEHNEALPVIASFTQSAPVFILGSSWPKDEKLLAEVWSSFPVQWKLIIAPHEISEEAINRLRVLFLSCKTYSEWAKNTSDSRVLILDNVGMLSRIYKYGKMAHIGGGWGEGIHNILEPAAFGLPVFFGPQHEKFVEAKGFKEMGFAFAIQQKQDYIRHLTPLWQRENLAALSARIIAFMHSQKGASDTVLEYLNQELNISS